MNKKIKITIAGIASLSVFSTICPGELAMITTKAYAEVSNYSLADTGELKSLEVKSTDGNDIEICDDYGGHKENLTDVKTYYATLGSNSDGVIISAEAAGDDYVTKIFESDKGNSTAHNSGEKISVEKGQSTLYIRTFTSEEAFKNAEEDEDVTDCDKTYKININKIATDEIYLENLTLDSGNIPINFDRDTCEYNVSIDEDTEDVTFRATPEDTDYIVKIDGFTVEDEDHYKKDLHLQMGKNQVKINVTNDYDKIRTYTLNITRGATTKTNDVSIGMGTGTTDTSKSASNIQTVKYSQWVQVNGKWQYNDSIGNPVKSNWVGNYYLGTDGNMATGWLSNGGKWYYLDNDGAAKIGWQLINGNWYYLNAQGVMVNNTTINGFKLGNDGALTN